MADIDYFKRFVPKNDAQEKLNYDVWSYTRVSSKDQFDRNSSVTNQINANREYASKNNYHITEEFGGTYESAKSDFTRKEFKRLIDKVKGSRKKVYAIIVYKMSRFSRSGGNAIGLVNMLVEEMGVHLIETCSGLSTTTERGKMAIYESLFHASKENLERKEIIIPFMKAHIRGGKRFGISPPGYDHYGPRVRNDKFLSRTQRIEVNKDGELLKEAWQWKASGLYSDVQIIARLEARGLIISKQAISKIWRNPFYCGILINKIVEEPVQGNWPPLVSREDFIKVQHVLENNPSGYTQNKEEILRPLTRLLKCNNCKGYMIGYRIKKVNLHYYKCRDCRGVSVNAHTTPKSKRKGLDDVFIDFLNNFRLPDGIAPLVKMQLTKLFSQFNDNSVENENSLKTQLAALEKKLKDLKIRHGLGDIDKETYDLTSEHISDQIRAVHKEQAIVSPKVSNLEKLLSQSLEKLSNIGLIWASSDLDNKRRIQKTLFPEGIYYDVKNHQCLTTKINEFVRVAAELARVSGEKEKGTFQENPEKSLSVARSGVEPETSGL